MNNTKLQGQLLISYLIKGLLDLVEVIEVVLHCHTDGVHSMRACEPLPSEKLIEVILMDKRSHIQEMTIGCITDLHSKHDYD